MVPRGDAPRHAQTLSNTLRSSLQSKQPHPYLCQSAVFVLLYPVQSSLAMPHACGVAGSTQYAQDFPQALIGKIMHSQLVQASPRDYAGDALHSHQGFTQFCSPAPACGTPQAWHAVSWASPLDTDVSMLITATVAGQPTMLGAPYCDAVDSGQHVIFPHWTCMP